MASGWLDDANVVVEEDEDVPMRVRMTDFYGLNRDDWLSLVVKVSWRELSEAQVAEIASTAVSSWRRKSTKSPLKSSSKWSGRRSSSIGNVRWPSDSLSSVCHTVMITH